MRFAEITPQIDVFNLVQCHLNAFYYFGGYPQEILYDNMKQVVLDRKPVSPDSKWNPKFEDSSGITALFPVFAGRIVHRPKGRSKAL